MRPVFYGIERAPEYLIWANLKWGNHEHIILSAIEMEALISKHLTSARIVKDLHGELWDDIGETKVQERARTLVRYLTIRKIVHGLKNEPLIIENIRDEFELLGDCDRVKAVLNYNKFLKFGEWCSYQFSVNDPELIEKWKALDEYINDIDTVIREKIDKALFNLENDIFDSLNDEQKDKIKQVGYFINDGKTLKKVQTILCPCGGRYTEHNLYKHRTTTKHLIYTGEKINENKENKNKILCECGTTINRNHYMRHRETIKHNYKLKLKYESEKNQREREQIEEKEQIEAGIIVLTE
jgi:hypothetical protein